MNNVPPEIKSILRERGVSDECPECHKSALDQFDYVQTVTPIHTNEKFKNGNVPVVPALTMICVDCGFIRSFSLITKNKGG